MHSPEPTRTPACANSTRRVAAVFIALAVGPVVALDLTAGLLGVALLAGFLLFRVTFAVRLPSCRATAAPYLVAIAWQVAHFLEELTQGFAELFPRQFGCPAWAESRFVTFNVVYYAIFGLALAGFLVRRASLAAPACAFVTATLVGGPAHTVMALRAGGYFPGLITSWVGSGLAVWLIRRWRRLAAGECRR